MRRGWPLPRRCHVGIALAPDRLVAVLPGDAPAAPWVRPLAPPGDPAVTWPDLADALGALREAAALPPLSGILHVALLPPLGQLRRIELAGLSLAEARQVLQREPSRHFPFPADVAPIELDISGEGWRHVSPFTVFAAPRALIEEIDAAARASGWQVAEIIPAEAAWAAGASALLPRASDGECAIVVCDNDRVEVLRVQADRIVTIRRVPTSTADIVSRVRALAGRGDGADAARPAAAVIGESPVADQLRAVLAAPDAPQLSRTGDGALYFSPALLAARFAPRAAGPALLPEADRLALHRQARRATKLRFAAAAVLLLAAGALQLWGDARERTRIVSERARLRGTVAEAMAVRDSLAEAARQLAVLHSAVASAPRWSALLASLSAELPDDAYLISLRAGNDTVRLEGSASRASAVFDALAHVRGVRTVRPEGPIRQEVSADGVATEHFALSAPLGRAP